MHTETCLELLDSRTNYQWMGAYYKGCCNTLTAEHPSCNTVPLRSLLNTRSTRHDNVTACHQCRRDAQLHHSAPSEMKACIVSVVECARMHWRLCIRVSTSHRKSFRGVSMSAISHLGYRPAYCGGGGGGTPVSNWRACCSRCCCWYRAATAAARSAALGCGPIDGGGGGSGGGGAATPP